MAATVKIMNNRLMIYFPYDAVLISKLQAIPSARFEKVYKAWSLPLTRVSYDLLKTTTGITEARVEKWLMEQSIQFSMSTLKTKTELMTHQKEAVAFVLTKFGLEVKS